MLFRSCFVNKKLSLDCVDIVCEKMGEILYWDEKRVATEKIESKEFIDNFF